MRDIVAAIKWQEVVIVVRRSAIQEYALTFLHFLVDS